MPTHSFKPSSDVRRQHSDISTTTDPSGTHIMYGARLRCANQAEQQLGLLCINRLRYLVHLGMQLRLSVLITLQRYGLRFAPTEL